MKKWLFFLLFAPFYCLAENANTKGFTINGQIEGFKDGTQIRLVKNGENADLSKTGLQNGKFVLKGNVDEPVLCFLFVGSEKPVEIYVENKTISVKAKLGQLDKAEIIGSVSHKEFKEFTALFIPLAQQSSSLATTINNTPPGSDRDGLMNSYNTIQKNMQNGIENFVKQKNKSLVAAFVLSATYDFNQDIMALEKRYNLLQANVKKSGAGKKLLAFIEENKIGAIGSNALDFTQPDTTGRAISLSSFRGKYVLVDFWASWCGPCRRENPTVVENYNKFKTKNFTVLGVSLDRPGQKEQWINAIHTDSLNWSHVSDLQFWNNAAAKLYRVQGIPQNFLVDPQGKIVGKNLRGPALEAKLCEILGCN